MLDHPNGNMDIRETNFAIRKIRRISTRMERALF
jgi:hypothetical protein